MPNRAKVRSIEDLRVNFDIETVLDYFVYGKLLIWLNDRYYLEEIAKIKELYNNLSDLMLRLFKILGIEINQIYIAFDLNSILNRK